MKVSMWGLIVFEVTPGQAFYNCSPENPRLVHLKIFQLRKGKSFERNLAGFQRVHFPGDPSPR